MSDQLGTLLCGLAHCVCCVCGTMSLFDLVWKVHVPHVQKLNMETGSGS
jgi:hypothetical protein